MSMSLRLCLFLCVFLGLLAEHRQHAPRDREAAEHVDGRQRQGEDGKSEDQRVGPVGAAAGQQQRSLDSRTGIAGALRSVPSSLVLSRSGAALPTAASVGRSDELPPSLKVLWLRSPFHWCAQFLPVVRRKLAP